MIKSINITLMHQSVVTKEINGTLTFEFSNLIECDGKMPDIVLAMAPKLNDCNELGKGVRLKVNHGSFPLNSQR
jgi:hypothetical protein